MKRYRVLAYSFDTRAVILSTKIQAAWEDRIRKQWEENQNNTREGLVHEYGALNFQRKIDNFIALGANPLSVLAFHNKFLEQCRNSFVIGSYYPALVGACTLGERILNRLIIALRDHFKGTKEYKSLHQKESFEKWTQAIDTLVSWDSLLPETAILFRELKPLRNKAIHFNPETDTNDRELSLSALLLIQEIVEKQFSAFGTQPWYIEGTKGASFVAKTYETNPFVREIIIPNCAYVGPLHRLKHASTGWIVEDSNDYEQAEITDEEYASRYGEIVE